MPELTTYLVATAVFVLIDGLWLGVVARSFYARQLGSLIRKRPEFGTAAVFYLLYPVGLTVLAIEPAGEDVLAGAALGAVLGLTAYGTYNLTNMSTLRDWPRLMSCVDLIWGTLLSAVVSVLTILLLR